MLRHRHQTRQGDPRWVRISPYPLINHRTASINSLAPDWPELVLLFRIPSWSGYKWSGIFQLTNWTDHLSLIKSALPVSIPGFTLSNLKHANHYFQTMLNSVTLSAVGCTGCAHHNGPFLKRTNYELHSAEFLHDSSGMLRHHHQTRPGDPRWVRISPYQLTINPLTASRYSMEIDWPELA